MRRLALLVGWLVPGIVLVTPGCLDPVHTDAQTALGDEVAGIPEGPTHRAGQPCTVCHGGVGPGSPDFAAAGTVYDVRGGNTPLIGASVVLTDKTGAVFSAETNVVGNFYVGAREFAPVVPMTVYIEYGGVKKVMETQIGRNGGCAICHRGSGDASHMPAVYFREASP